MASPPYNLDITDPSDVSLGQNFPANERQFRDNLNSYLNTEHDANTGFHAFQELTTTAKNALTSPPKGMLVYDTTLSQLQINTGTPGSPVWANCNVGSSLHRQIFVAGGTFTIPVPGVKFTVVGGGGGGGGGYNSVSGNPSAGAGGGAGGSCVLWLQALTVGNTITVTVGAQGTGGATGTPGAAGTAGTSSTIASGTQTITTVTGGGGQGGNGGPATGLISGGAGGTATNGDLNIVGQQGAPTGSGGMGVSGVGGSSLLGFGDPSGNAGVYGAGGGGGGWTIAGGNGSAGVVIAEWIQ